MIPVRCFTCNRIIGNLTARYQHQLTHHHLADQFNLLCQVLIACQLEHLLMPDYDATRPYEWSIQNDEWVVDTIRILTQTADGAQVLALYHDLQSKKPETAEFRALNALGLSRECCRGALMYNIDSLSLRIDYERATSHRSRFDRSDKSIKKYSQTECHSQSKKPPTK